MKKSVVFLAIMMSSTIIFAQRQQPADKGTGTRRSDQLKKELSLSDEQYSKVKAIRTKYAGEYSRIRKDTSLTQGSARNQQKKLREHQEQEVKGVLTPEQWTKYAAMKTRHMENRKKYHHGKTDKG